MYCLFFLNVGRGLVIQYNLEKVEKLIEKDNQIDSIAVTWRDF